jgi:hypothetical protein
VEASDARKLSDGLNEEFGDFLQKYKDNLKKLKEMIRDAKASSQTHQPGAVGGGSKTNVGLEDLNEEAPLTNAQTTVAKAVDGLEDRIDLLEAIIKSGDTEAPAGFEARMRNVESKVGGDAYRLNDQHFGSLYELELWVEESQVPSCGHFWDLFSSLVAMRATKRPKLEKLGPMLHITAPALSLLGRRTI